MRNGRIEKTKNKFSVISFIRIISILVILVCIGLLVYRYINLKNSDKILGEINSDIKIEDKNIEINGVAAAMVDTDVNSLKEKNPDIKIIGVDADGSILKSFHETGEIHKEEVHPYQIEGMGKNLIPSALLFDKIDEFVRVNDEMSAYRTREIALKEARMGGYTTGAVTQGLIQYANAHQLTENDLVVLIYPDHGSRYITKVYSDKWMEEQGFINNCFHNYEQVFKTEIIK